MRKIICLVIYIISKIVVIAAKFAIGIVAAVEFKYKVQEEEECSSPQK